MQQCQKNNIFNPLMNNCMVNGFKALLFVTVTGIMAASCVKGDNPIQRYEDPRNQGQGGVPVLGPGWSKVTIPLNSYDVVFVNDTLGFLASFRDGVYRSTNGGETWTRTNAQKSDYVNLFFLNEKYGWAVSVTKDIAKTTDSGKTWATTNTSYEFRDVFFRDENNGYASTYQGLIKTTDGGVTWALVPNAPKDVTSVYFIDEQNGFCGTEANGYRQTTDGGSSFTPVNGLPNEVFTTQFFKGTDAQKGVVVGSDGYVNKTTNNGATWTKGPKIKGDYFDFNFKDIDNGFVMTINNVFKVEGNTVTNVLFRPAADRNVHFWECDFNADLTRGWVVYNGGELYRYVKP
ncbi:WD40/YVTN/BNR-like repeat-containing protein [Pseudobacter ginsenosidimutans]|uniref:Photosynthesis system II assembly factor YCF48-like protein n=1 Tax=Pseudobacter ginsenosidimutans TaxID=661488 RepID=A0A4Q7MSW9_9BACT|nr:YCF48-related protein [Pseudobacter ginsenosidimutans]RZS71578.1 photosynthesis system II assembly factor YCF48-like protein [Pseudobacter ginsenosidimutans]